MQVFKNKTVEKYLETLQNKIEHGMLIVSQSTNSEFKLQQAYISLCRF